MKKVIPFTLLVTISLLLGACTRNNSQGIISESSSSSVVSSSEVSTSSSASYPISDFTPSSSIPISSLSTSSVIQSSPNQSSASQGLVNNQLSTDSGLVIKFKNEGASIESIKWDNKQIAKDGFIVGRCTNRIAGGKFTINGVEYQTDKNSGSNSLHGGNGSGMNSWRGPFATANWNKVEQTASSITYSISSPDGANGYPGKMDMTVKYTLSNSGELSIEYSATTTKDTLCNPTNHLFMAMNGNTSFNDIKLWIDADNYTPLNNQIPTGEIASVTGTQFDFTTEKVFDGSKNYDDNLCLNGEGYRKVATMTGTSLGVKVDVFTDRPGLQLYKDSGGSICLETQMYPDAINQPNFEDPILKAGEQFYSKTTYAFSEVK